VVIDASGHVSEVPSAEDFQSQLPHILEKIHLVTFTMGKTAPPKKKGGT
jgi:hypothetical protein